MQRPLGSAPAPEVRGDLVQGALTHPVPDSKGLLDFCSCCSFFSHHPEIKVQKLPPPTHPLFLHPPFAISPRREGRATSAPSHGHRRSAAASGRAAAPSALITRQKAHQQQNQHGTATLGSLPEQPQQWFHCSAASSLPRATHIFPTPGRSPNLPAQ